MIIYHMLDEPVDAQTLRRILRACLEYGLLRYSSHARQRMGPSQRDVSEQDVENCLWAGCMGNVDFEKGSWRYTVSTVRLSVVVAIDTETSAIVVTVIRTP
jgi:hypothetical protein